MPTKICQECGKQKDVLDFKRNFNTSDGYAKKCLACYAEKLGLTQQEYEWKLLSGGAAIPKDKSKDRDKLKVWQTQNPEKRFTYGRMYRQRNADRVKENNNRRKARKSNTLENVFTEKDRQQLLLEFNGCCAYCGVKSDKMEMDHVIPLSRGGQHTKSNIVPACFNCNRSKGAKTPEQAGMEVRKNG